MSLKPQREESSSPEYDPDPDFDQDLAPSSPPPQWDSDLDTDGINSISSDELHATRPNRWRGPKSTWEKITEQERLTSDGIERVKNGDLAAHLYNAFALKQRAKRDGNAGDGADGDDALEALLREGDTGWKPPASWTAWPMSAETVPGGDGEAKRADADGSDGGKETSFKPAPLPTSSMLEELVSATILRLARERFARRHFAENPVKDEKGKGVVRSIEADPESDSDVRPSLEGPDATSEEEGAQNKERRKTSSKLLTPVVSAADDVSYELLRPSTRHILAQLDRTLLILHDARVAGISERPRGSRESSRFENDESSDSDSDTTSDSSEARSSRSRSVQREPVKRGRGRPRSTAPISRKPQPKRAVSEGAKRRVGRPSRAPVRKEGESEAEMLIRHARERHLRIPVLSGAEAGSEGSESTPVARKKSTARSKSRPRQKSKPGFKNEMSDHENGSSSPKKKQKATKSPDPRLPNETRHEAHVRIARSRHRRQPTASSAASSSDSDSHSRSFFRTLGQESSHELSEWGLRDWSDVLGAAALAGFPPGAIARATQRCATLFGQGMRIDTLAEGGKGKGRVTTEYLPQQIGQEIAQDDDEEADSAADERIRLSMVRSVTREPSMGLASELSADEERRHSSDEEELDDRSARLKRRRRSRSSSVASRRQMHYCTEADCARAVEGFSRRANLVRHMRLVHGIAMPARSPGGRSSGAEESGLEDEDVESADEREGAVHVDGFLRPIKVRPGWRGEDTRSRTRMTRAGTPGLGPRSEGEDEEMAW